MLFPLLFLHLSSDSFPPSLSLSLPFPSMSIHPYLSLNLSRQLCVPPLHICPLSPSPSCMHYTYPLLMLPPFSQTPNFSPTSPAFPFTLTYIIYSVSHPSPLPHIPPSLACILCGSYIPVLSSSCSSLFTHLSFLHLYSSLHLSVVYFVHSLFHYSVLPTYLDLSCIHYCNLYAPSTSAMLCLSLFCL